MNKSNNGTNVLKRFLAFLLTFFILYGPRLNTNLIFISDTMLTATIACTGLFLFSVMFKKKMIQVPLISIFLLLVIITVYSLIVVWANNFRDTFVLLRNGRALVAFWGVVGLGQFFNDVFEEDALEKGIEYIFLAGFVHGLIMWGMLGIEPLREFVHNLVVVDLYDRDILNVVRVSGLMSQGGDGTSLVQGMITLTSPFVLNSKKGFSKLIYFIFFIVLWTSSFLSARAGFVLSGSLLPLIWFFHSKKIKFKIKKDNLKIIIPLLLTIVLMFLFIPEIIWDNLFNHWDSPLYRLMEPIRTFGETGRLATRSTNELSGMIMFPTDTIEFIFGSSNMGRGGNLSYIPSDIGYIRLFFATGLLGSILLYSIFIAMILKIKKYTNIDSAYYKFFLISILFTLIANYKMVFALSRTNFNFLVLLFVLIMNYSNMLYNKNSVNIYRKEHNYEH